MVYRVVMMRMIRLCFIVGLDSIGWRLCDKLMGWYGLKRTLCTCDDGVYNDN